MSNLWLNIRMGTWFIQSTRGTPWKYSISNSQYHKDNPPEKWFHVCEFKPKEMFQR